MWLNCLVLNEFPQEFDKYMKVHQAAKWYEADPGPWLGHVIIWKLQSSPHLDDGDAGPSVSWTVGGKFVGGNMEYLHLHSRFLYSPGAVVVGWSNVLWHRVTPWELRPMQGAELVDYGRRKLTPGRVASVSYTPSDSYQKCKDKEAGWGRNTMWGQINLEDK